MHPSAALPIEADGVVIDRLRASDAAALTRSHSDPANARYQGWRSPLPVADALAFIEANDAEEPFAPGCAIQLAVREVIGGPMVGDLYVARATDPPTEVELGITLVPGAHGRGLATRALRALLDAVAAGMTGGPVTRAVAWIDADNAPSLALFPRLGFTEEERAAMTAPRRDGTTGVEVRLALAWPATDR